MSITPIAAQLVGGGRTAEVGATIRQGLLLTAAASAPAILLVVSAAPLFALFRIDPEATDIAIRYLRAAAFGLPAGMCYILLRSASEGIGHTFGPMVIAGVALLLNALLNYAFIYGKFGAPELGGEGCGRATAIVMWFELAAVLVLTRFPYFRATGLWQRFERPNPRHMGHILKVGVPIGLSSFVGMVLFTVIGFLVGASAYTPSPPTPSPATSTGRPSCCPCPLARRLASASASSSALASTRAPPPWRERRSARRSATPWW